MSGILDLKKVQWSPGLTTGRLEVQSCLQAERVSKSEPQCPTRSAFQMYLSLIIHSAHLLVGLIVRCTIQRCPSSVVDTTEI